MLKKFFNIWFSQIVISLTVLTILYPVSVFGCGYLICVEGNRIEYTIHAHKEKKLGINHELSKLDHPYIKTEWFLNGLGKLDGDINGQTVTYRISPKEMKKTRDRVIIELKVHYNKGKTETFRRFLRLKKETPQRTETHTDVETLKQTMNELNEEISHLFKNIENTDLLDVKILHQRKKVSRITKKFYLMFLKIAVEKNLNSQDKYWNEYIFLWQQYETVIDKIKKIVVDQANALKNKYLINRDKNIEDKWENQNEFCYILQEYIDVIKDLLSIDSQSKRPKSPPEDDISFTVTEQQVMLEARLKIFRMRLEKYRDEYEYKCIMKQIVNKQ